MLALINKLIAILKADLNSPQARLIAAASENAVTSPVVLNELKTLFTSLKSHPECGAVFELTVEAIDHLVANPIT